MYNTNLTSRDIIVQTNITHTYGLIVFTLYHVVNT